MKHARLITGTLMCALATASHATGAYDFDYQVSNSTQAGIVRVFDDGKNTVVAFTDIAAAAPTISARDGSIITFKKVQNYAVLPFVTRDFTVVTKGQAAVIHYGSDPAPKAAVSTAPVLTRPVPVPAPPAAPRGPAASPLSPATTPVPSPASTSASAVKAAPSAPLVAAAAPVGPTQQTWTLRQGDWLHDDLKAWAKRAGYAFEWQAKNRFRVKVSVDFTGDFQTVISEVVTAYSGADKPVYLDIFPDMRPTPTAVVSNAVKKAAQ